MKLLTGGYGRQSSVNFGEMNESVIIWSLGPQLLLSRLGHRSIGIDDYIYHIGGKGSR